MANESASRRSLAGGHGHGRQNPAGSGIDCRQSRYTRSLIIYIPITRQNRGSSLEVPLDHLPFLDPESTANVQGVGSLRILRFEKRLGFLPAADLKAIKIAMVKACAL